MNSYAPQHSRLFKEMILVESSTKPFTYTAKNTPRRQAIINEYEPEIEAAYQAVRESSQTDVPSPEKWDEISVLHFVRAIVQRVMGKGVEDDVNLFEHGCDRYVSLECSLSDINSDNIASLQATYIRNALFHAVGEGTERDIRHIPSMIVYQYPTITSLTFFVMAFISDSDSLVTKQTTVADMQAMVTKYSQNFPTHTARCSESNSVPRVVLLTGTTGGIGASLLSLLLEDQMVSKVYAVNRRSSSGVKIEERHKSILDKQGLDYEALLRAIENGRLVFIESTISDSSLQVPQGQLQEVCVTHLSFRSLG
jgi:hypothetical protein